MIESANQDSEALRSQGSRPQNFVQRLVGIFASPRATLEDIAARPDWIIPLALVVLGTLLLTLLALPAILADAEKAMEKSLESRQLTDQQLEQARSIGMGYAKNFSVVTAGIYAVISSLLAAAALFFVGNIVMAGKANYRQVFCVYVWTGLVGLVGYIIRSPIALSRGTMRVFFGPAVLFPSDSEPTSLFRIASAFDVFAIWRLALVAIGFAAIYRIGVGKAVSAVGTLYVLIVAASVIFGGAFGP